MLGIGLLIIKEAKKEEKGNVRAHYSCASVGEEEKRRG